MDFTNLHSFTGSNDGANPDAVLVRAIDTNLYGTTPLGGTYTKWHCVQNQHCWRTSLYSFTGNQGAIPWPPVSRTHQAILIMAATALGRIGSGMARIIPSSPYRARSMGRWPAVSTIGTRSPAIMWTARVSLCEGALAFALLPFNPFARFANSYHPWTIGEAGKYEHLFTYQGVRLALLLSRSREQKAPTRNELFSADPIIWHSTLERRRRSNHDTFRTEITYG